MNTRSHLSPSHPALARSCHPAARRTRFLTWVAMGLAGATSGVAMDIPYDHHIPLTPENAIIGHFSKDKAPVVRITGPDAPAPASFPLEAATVPQADRVVEAAFNLVRPN